MVAGPVTRLLERAAKFYPFTTGELTSWMRFFSINLVWPPVEPRVLTLRTLYTLAFNCS